MIRNGAAAPTVLGNTMLGKFTVARAATASRIDLTRIRPVMGEALNSPKQPQPMSGRTLRSSISAQVATTNSTHVPTRTSVARALVANAPAVAISPRPKPNSTANNMAAAQGRNLSGKTAVGPSPALTDRRPMARASLAELPPSSIAASSGIWMSRSAVSMSAADRERRVEAARIQFAAERDEAGECQVCDPAAIGVLAGNAPVIEEPGYRRAAGDRQRPGDARALVPDAEGCADRQVGQVAERRCLAISVARLRVFQAAGR